MTSTPRLRRSPGWVSLPCMLLALSGCGDSPVEPLATLPATYHGQLQVFGTRHGADPNLWGCVGDASFTVEEDGSGSFEWGPYTANPEIPDARRTCELWYPTSGTLSYTVTGTWITGDTLEFHHGFFHADEDDVWRAYVSTDSMRFVGLETYGRSLRFEFVGERR